MADPELEAIRQQRMAELQGRRGDAGSEQAQQEAKQREEDMRNSILSQVLSQAARARLNNLALVKPEKAKAVENYLIQMAKFGQLGGKFVYLGGDPTIRWYYNPQATQMLTTSPVFKFRCKCKVQLVFKFTFTVLDHVETVNKQLSEQGLIEILEKVSRQTEKKTTVKFNRRKVMDSDEEDD